MSVESLLSSDEPSACRVLRAEGRSPYFFTCDHAGHRLPAKLGTLGVSEHDLTTHIAWDIGVLGLAQRLSERLDACVVTQTYSRLVVDVNRPPGTPESMVVLSERTRIPGNEGLSPLQVRAREEAVFWPYHRQISAELDRRQAQQQPTLLVALHSFTPVFKDVARPWHMGVLYGRDARVARPLLELLRRDPALVVGENEPYAVSDDTDYTLLVHGEQRGLLHVELEFRQDLLANELGQDSFAARMATVFEQLLPDIFPA